MTTPTTTQTQTIKMPQDNSIEKGKWILISYAKYVETYKKEPPSHEDIGCDKDTIFLLNTGNAIFDNHFFTNLQNNDFGTVENPENIEFYDADGNIYLSNKYSAVIVYVMGDMVVKNNFVDDFGQITCCIQVVVDGTLYAKNMSCQDTYFHIKNAVIEDIFVAIGNDGSYDGRTINAFYCYNPDHDVRARSKAQFRCNPETLIKKLILRQDADNEFAIGELLENGLTSLIFKDDQTAIKNYDYWLKTVNIICSKLKLVPIEMRDKQICLAALHSATNDIGKLIKLFPKEITNSREFWIEAIAINYGTLEFAPTLFLNDLSFIAESINVKGGYSNVQFCNYWYKKIRDAVKVRDLETIKTAVERYGLDLDRVVENKRMKHGYQDYFLRSLAWNLADTSSEFVAMWDYLCSVCDIYKHSESYLSKTALINAVANPHVENIITPSHKKLFALPGWSQEDYHQALQWAVKHWNLKYVKWLVSNNYGNIKADDIFMMATDFFYEYSDRQFPLLHFLVANGTPIQSSIEAIRVMLKYSLHKQNIIQVYNYLVEQGLDMNSDPELKSRMDNLIMLESNKNS